MSSELPLYGFGGSGGGSLKIKLVGGVSQPADPSANTIWVNTSETITGYAFSSTEPEAPYEGMIWVRVGATSPAAFSVSDKDPVMVYPMAAMQYISGTWVSVGAESYINGQWTGWTNFLYENGSQFEAVTGGWSAGESGGGTASIDTSCITMTTSGDNARRIHVATNSALSLSNFKTLYATVQVVSVNKGGQTQPVLRLGYADSRDTSLASATTKTEVDVTETGEITVSLDISTVTGSKYVIVGIGFYKLSVRVTKVWLE